MRSRYFGILLISCFFTCVECSAQVRDSYVEEIKQAASDLDAKRFDEAYVRLEATEKSQRSFEFDYLKARLAQGRASNAAPDLITTLARPKVESRYGVLNEVSREVVFICRDGGIRVYELSQPDKPKREEMHSAGATAWSGAFSYDGKRFVSGHQNGDVLVWDAATWKLRETVKMSDLPVRELAVAPDGGAFVAEAKKELELWSLAGPKASKVAGVGPRLNFGEGLSISPKGDLIATGGMFDIVLHDAKTGKELRKMRHASYTMGLEFSPDGTLIASAPRGNVNKFLAVFDVNKPAPLFNAGPFASYIAQVAWSPDGKRMAATGCDKELRIFDAMSGKVVLSLKLEGCSAEPAFSRDGKLLGWNEPSGYRYIELMK